MSRVDILDRSHFDMIQMRPQDLDRIMADPYSDIQFTALLNAGLGATLFDDDGVALAIFGVLQLWPGVFEVWVFPSVSIQNRSMIYLKTIKQCLNSFEKSHKPSRLQTTAFADPVHDRWMRFLGFECETPNGMKNYSVLGQTFNLWSKTFGGD